MIASLFCSLCLEIRELVLFSVTSILFFLRLFGVDSLCSISESFSTVIICVLGLSMLASFGVLNFVLETLLPLAALVESVESVLEVLGFFAGFK